MPSGGTTYGMSFSGIAPISSLASSPQPLAAIAAPDVATIRKNDLRSIPLSDVAPGRASCEGLDGGSSAASVAGREQRAHRPSTLVGSSRGIALAKRADQYGRRSGATSGSRPCEPYHARKERSIEFRRLRTLACEVEGLAGDPGRLV